MSGKADKMRIKTVKSNCNYNEFKKVTKPLT